MSEHAGHVCACRGYRMRLSRGGSPCPPTLAASFCWPSKCAPLMCSSPSPLPRRSPTATNMTSSASLARPLSLCCYVDFCITVQGLKELTWHAMTLLIADLSNLGNFEYLLQAGALTPCHALFLRTTLDCEWKFACASFGQRGGDGHDTCNWPIAWGVAVLQGVAPQIEDGPLTSAPIEKYVFTCMC